MVETPAPDFRSFVAGLAASAAAGLQQVEQAGAATAEGGDAESASAEQRGGDVREALTQARYVIDTLTMLQQKTSGNLTDEEERFLKAVLTDLRVAFVRADDRLRKGKGGGASG